MKTSWASLNGLTWELVINSLMVWTAAKGRWAGAWTRPLLHTLSHYLPLRLYASAASTQAISCAIFRRNSCVLTRIPATALRFSLRRSSQESFGELNERVQRDLQDMERVFQLEKERKQLGVMRGLLRKAFPQAEVRQGTPHTPL